MSKEIDVHYPNEAEIREQVSFIVQHANPQTQQIIDPIHENMFIQVYSQIYLALKLAYPRMVFSFNLQSSFDAIIIGIMLIFGLLVPGTT